MYLLASLSSISLPLNLFVLLSLEVSVGLLVGFGEEKLFMISGSSLNCGLGKGCYKVLLGLVCLFDDKFIFL